VHKIDKYNFLVALMNLDNICNFSLNGYVFNWKKILIH
jgi:hypothetical protein